MITHVNDFYDEINIVTADRIQAMQALYRYDDDDVEFTILISSLSPGI